MLVQEFLYADNRFLSYTRGVVISNHSRGENSGYSTGDNYQEMCQIIEIAIENQFGGICISGPVVPAVPLKSWHEVLHGSSLPHESGNRMT